MDPAVSPVAVLASQPPDQCPDTAPGRWPPGPPARGPGAQRRRTMSRCQRTIGSGVTSSRSPWRRAFGITPSRVASRARSAQFSFGQRGCRCCRTASWWRRIKISAVFHASSRRDSRSHAATRVIRRNTNRRHMIGDHHRRTGGEQLRWSEPWTGFSARTTTTTTRAGDTAKHPSQIPARASPQRGSYPGLALAPAMHDLGECVIVSRCRLTA